MKNKKKYKKAPLKDLSTKPAAASWYNGLTVFKRELYIGRHYADDTPTDDKINTLYKMYNDWSNDDLEQVSSCR